MVAALAAALAAMAAQSSEREGTAQRCRRLMEDLAPLARADAESYADVFRASGETERKAALARASEVPLAVAVGARETAEIGAELFERGNPKLKGEAAAAALFGEAAARVASTLVALNLTSNEDGRVARAADAARAAARAARRAAGGT
jgi:formiminotetrahydrofolate cyclodeaminase